VLKRQRLAECSSYGRDHFQVVPVSGVGHDRVVDESARMLSLI